VKRIAMSISPNCDQKADRAPCTRRRLPLSLKGFVVILLLLGGGSLAAVGIPIWRKESAISHLEAAGGLVRKVPGGPTWLRQYIGDYWMSYFDDVVQVRLNDHRATDATLVWLKRLPRLGALSLDRSNVSDEGLVYLKNLHGLSALSLAQTQATDAGLAHLSELVGLQMLVLDNTSVTDAGLSHLEGLAVLEWLSLAHTPVGDAGM